MIRAVHILWSAFCLLPFAMGQSGGVRAELDLSNPRFCPSTKMLQFSAKITFTTESPQPTLVPRILGVDEIHVARSLDDLEGRIYEFGESRTWDLLNLSGQRLDADFYNLRKGSS
ncbi:MAG TPA: hypothetical protein VLM42_08265, partial [Bryobacteraceae bacterium]|nr:hypothetical protein [Bryobacteraceae bacterium]